MAKILLPDIASQFASQEALNERFEEIARQLNDKVLYRENPETEPNEMRNDLDMGLNDILNIRSLYIDGVDLAEAVRQPTAPDSEWGDGINNPVTALRFKQMDGEWGEWEDLRGHIGLTGTQGDTGIQGPAGADGVIGVDGADGADSTVAGPQGIQGEAGVDGTNGSDGADGAQGIQGETGATGADSTVAGPQGIQGVKGDTGDTGADSIVAGPQGIQGIQGIQGDTGPAGADGNDGADSTVAGPQGDPGVDAVVGEYASFYQSTGGITAIAATAVTLNLSSTQTNSNATVFALAANELTVNKTATFKITTDSYINNSSTARCEYSLWLEKDGVEVAGTRHASYQRGYDSGQSQSMTTIIDITSGEVLRIRIQRTDGTGTTGYQDDNGTRLTIEEK